MQMRTLDLPKLFKNSERSPGEMCPFLPFHSEVGADRTNSTSNLEKKNIFKKSLILTCDQHVSNSLKHIFFPENDTCKN